jgi:NAD(P)-dependent dehydrogenase (short-subunit alcohol dehydrogenase family)
MPFWKPRVAWPDCAAEDVVPTDRGNAMEVPKYKTALIVGAGEGLSASLARLFAREGIRVALAARGIEKLGALCSETGAKAFACNATEPGDVERLFGLVEREIAVPDLVVYNASGRARGAFVELVPDDVAQAISVSAFGGFLVAQQAAKRMLPNRHGAILFTGASASVKGYPQSAPFAMGKFALRGLAQSMARELSPQGIHVAHFVIDGGIRSAARAEPADRPDSMLDPDAIAASYWSVLQQPRSAWTWELELRPWVEKF